MDRLRTFGIVAHIDAGKTTLTERILHDTGAQAWVGSVDQGTASTDWLPQERSRGISIMAAATRVTWGANVLQVVDTPGHVDFVAEVERCLHVLDGVVVVVDGVRGVESQTEVVWQQATARRLARLVFVNKLDRPGADFDAVVAEIGRVFECVAVPLVIPLADASGAFAGLGDAVTGAVQWFLDPPDAGHAVTLQAELRRAHDRLVEAVADQEDALLELVVAGKPISPGVLRASLRRALLCGGVVPVLAGAALWNRGVDWLLDAVSALLPAAADLPRTGLWSVERAGDPEAPFCGLVFKVQHHDVVWNYIRVVRGRLRAGTPYLRSRAGALPCEVGEVWVMQADRHRSVASAEPGEIVVVPGELGLRTGETLHDPNFPVLLPVPRFPAPVLAVTFEPDQAEHAHRLLTELRALAIDDPTLRVDHDQGQLVVRGMGELHLEIVADLLRSRVGQVFQLSRPRVDRRETIGADGCGEAEVRATIAGVEHHAFCRVEVTRLSEAQAPGIVEVGVGDSVAVTAAAQDLRQQVANGCRVGAMGGLRVKIVRVAPEGSAVVEALLQQAATKAMMLAIEQAGLVLLEPWVTFELWCPEESSAAVLADLGARTAVILGVSSGRLGARIRGKAPLARMLGYVTRLRSITKGRGQAALRPAGYESQPS
jgi:elongation factor G